MRPSDPRSGPCSGAKDEMGAGQRRFGGPVSAECVHEAPAEDLRCDERVAAGSAERPEKDAEVDDALTGEQATEARFESHVLGGYRRDVADLDVPDPVARNARE